MVRGPTGTDLGHVPAADKLPRARPSGPVRVLIADDSREFREALRAFLQILPGIEVVDAVADGVEAVAAARRGALDVVLLDLAMPILGGRDAARHIRRAENPPRVILLSVQGEEELRRVALEVQADGFLHKSEVARRLPALLQPAFGGGHGR